MRRRAASILLILGLFQMGCANNDARPLLMLYQGGVSQEWFMLKEGERQSIDGIGEVEYQDTARLDEISEVWVMVEGTHPGEDQKCQYYFGAWSDGVSK